MNFKNEIALTCMAATLCFASMAPLVAGESAVVSFPGAMKSASSPDGRYLLQWEGATEVSPHRLTILDQKSGTKALFFEFGRAVDIGWSPDGKSVFVTDHTGSNLSQCFIFTDPLKRQQLDLWAEAASKTWDLNLMLINDHAYLECVDWLSDTKVLMHVSGHGDKNPDGFSKWFTYEIGKGYSQIK